MLNQKEIILFAKYKDTPLINGKELRQKFRDVEGVNFSEVYAAISKYQVNKYGHMLSGKNDHWLPKKLFDKRNNAIRINRRKRCPKYTKQQAWVDVLGLGNEDER